MSSSPSTAAVVLAAGRGTRFGSQTPKLLQPLDGRALVAHVVATAWELDPRAVVVVVGHARAQVEAALADCGVVFALQREPRGTAHAVLAARQAVPAEVSELLVLSGDVPRIRSRTLRQLLELHRERAAAASLLSARVADPSGYGRILRDSPGGSVRGIVEDRDATPEQRLIDEINAGLYVFRAPLVFDVLEGVGRSNAQGEYYLTDAVATLVGQGERVEALPCGDPTEVLGVNRLEELEQLRRLPGVGAEAGSERS